MFMTSTVRSRQDLGLVLQRLAPTQGQKDTNYIHFPNLPATPLQLKQDKPVLLNASKRWGKCSLASSKLQVWGKELNTTSSPLYPRHVLTVTRKVIKDSGCSYTVRCCVTSTPLSVDSLPVKQRYLIIVWWRKVNSVWGMNHIHRRLGSEQVFV